MNGFQFLIYSLIGLLIIPYNIKAWSDVQYSKKIEDGFSYHFKELISDENREGLLKASYLNGPIGHFSIDAKIIKKIEGLSYDKVIEFWFNSGRLFVDDFYRDSLSKSKIEFKLTNKIEDPRYPLVPNTISKSKYLDQENSDALASSLLNRISSVDSLFKQNKYKDGYVLYGELTRIIYSYNKTSIQTNHRVVESFNSLKNEYFHDGVFKKIYPNESKNKLEIASIDTIEGRMIRHIINQLYISNSFDSVDTIFEFYFISSKININQKYLTQISKCLNANNSCHSLFRQSTHDMLKEKNNQFFIKTLSQLFEDKKINSENEFLVDGFIKKYPFAYSINRNKVFDFFSSIFNQEV